MYNLLYDHLLSPLNNHNLNKNHFVWYIFSVFFFINSPNFIYISYYDFINFEYLQYSLNIY